MAYPNAACTSPQEPKSPAKQLGRVFLIVAMLLVPRVVSAQALVSFSHSFAYVTNHNDGTISVIDTSSGTVVTTITQCTNCTNPGPAGLAVTPDGSRVYVANENAGTIAVIDTSTNTVSATITIPCPSEIACTPLPVGVAANPSSDFPDVYVTNTGDGSVTVINTTTNTVAATITANIGPHPFGVAVSPDGSVVYVTNGVGAPAGAPNNTVSVINTSTNTASATMITVGTNPTGVAFQPFADIPTAYVTNAGDGTVSVINANTNAVTTTITLPAGSAPYSVAFTPNGSLAYVTNQLAGGNASVFAINTSEQFVASTIPAGNTPAQVAITPDGTTAYVAVASGTFVTPIYTATNSTTTNTTVGASPFGVAMVVGLPETIIVTGNAQRLFFPFDNNAYSIQFDVNSGWAPAGSKVRVIATETSQAAWNGEASNYAGTTIAPFKVYTNGDGVVFTADCRLPDGTTPCTSSSSTAPDYTATITWKSSQADYCGSNPAMLQGDDNPPANTFTDVFNSCSSGPGDPTYGGRGTSTCSSSSCLSPWAMVFGVAGTPPTVTITTPANGATYTVNQVVNANYSCSPTAGTPPVTACTGTVADGAAIDTSSLGSKTFLATADVSSGPSGSASSTYSVASNVCLLYPASGAVKQGSDFPIKFYLCDASGNDVSSSSIVVNATTLVFVSGSTSGDLTITDTGNSNPDNNFRFDSTLGPSGGYIFNFKTTNLAKGAAYSLQFTVNGVSSTSYAVPLATK